MFVRRCPTLPHRPRCSTIGAGGLSFRVRNVAGRFPPPMTAVTLSTLSNVRADFWLRLFAGCDADGERESIGFSAGCGWPCHAMCVFGQVLGLLVPVH